MGQILAKNRGINYTMKDFYIIIRSVDFISQRASELFGGNKEKQLEFSLKSLAESIKGLNVRVDVLHQGSKYIDLIKSTLPESRILILDEVKDGAYLSVRKQIEYCIEQNDSDFCAILEDDYYYTPDCFRKIKQLFKDNVDIQYCTPADSIEYYTSFHHKLRHPFCIMSGGMLWRTVPGTTHTFFARKRVLIKDKIVFDKYIKIPFLKVPFAATDCSMWSALIKHGMYNPYYFFKCLIKNKYVAWSLFISWCLNWRFILTHYSRDLFAPTKTLAIHLDRGKFLPPGWDQERIKNLM